MRSYGISGISDDGKSIDNKSCGGVLPFKQPDELINSNANDGEQMIFKI